ncbi:dTDP-L-rhamnose 4-epimerase [Fundidesulfovibrio magnetotacticus]|uniref:dTDP-L-rhamnose 4-epimerase n=1 Tax=Fundidesulfovibrio magnetotacticus TaxID=2730080 RepID=A0A6V8LTB6_9BACT|nr:NAD-dependent epimerase/dehydratase family protein [Fundidesulfovibrio magnetotacticus]GFK93821.1 dTDP-L-rhamnose 4-epimerase [Fundidesulfovibrio magnetotacticus]
MTDIDKDILPAFAGKRALILGGLGFLGSSLALRLAGAGAKVMAVDAMIDEYGGNLFNIEPARDAIQVNFCDIRDASAMEWLVRDQDYVFHSAGQVCHLKSLSDPYPDVDINIRGTVVVMEALRKVNPRAKVVKLGSRGQYGPVLTLPAGEDVVPRPKGIYEISLLAAEHIIQSYLSAHSIPCVLTRLTNIYGPRAQMRHNRFCVANWFMRLALEKEPISVFGDGLIKRDFLYVDDCVDALLALAVHPEAAGGVYNIGHDRPSHFRELAETIARVEPGASWRYTPFSAERKAQEPGDFYSDITKIRTLTGWQPRVDLEEGVRRTLDYYRQHKARYW